MVDQRSNRRLGRVVGLWRYPVKSMGPEPLREAEISWFGLAGDRRWAFLRPGSERSPFPWYTLRDNDHMAQFQPRLEHPTSPERGSTLVRTPSGAEYDVTDPALGLALGSAGVRVIRLQRGAFDTFPVSIISTQTIAALEDRVGRRLETQRFRPNVLIEAEGDEPFQEDHWVGSEVQLGSTRLRVDKRDGRCAVITIDPATGQREPEVLRSVTQTREGCLGVYATPVQPGRVGVGDLVWG